jgi:periplasmic divalent cation tolerance protein
MAEVIQVLTTVGSEEDARAIARALVERRLAGCVQLIGPITSTYWWQGSVEDDTEWLCVIKSTADLYEALERAIQEVHPYEVPEILAVPVLKGSQGYLDWLRGELVKPA